LSDEPFKLNLRCFRILDQRGGEKHPPVFVNLYDGSHGILDMIERFLKRVPLRNQLRKGGARHGIAALLLCFQNQRDLQNSLHLDLHDSNCEGAMGG